MFIKFCISGFGSKRHFQIVMNNREVKLPISHKLQNFGHIVFACCLSTQTFNSVFNLAQSSVSSSTQADAENERKKWF